MVNKIFSIVFLSLFFSIPQANAQIQTRSDQELVGIDCSNSDNNCLDGGYSIKDYIYLIGFSRCDLEQNGNCLHDSTRATFSKNQASLVSAFIANESQQSKKYSPDNYVSGYTNCTTPAPGSGMMCNLVMTRKVSDGNGGYTWITENGSNFSVIVYQTPQNCPSGLPYIAGLGCLSNSLEVKSNRSITALTNTCHRKDNSCNAQASGESAYVFRPVPTTGNPIDLMTGSKIEHKTDIAFPFEFSRNYVSKRNHLGLLGKQWKHNYEKKLVTKKAYTQDSVEFIGSIIITQENDEEIIFTRESPSANFSLVFKDQKSFKLAMSGNNYVLTAPNGSQETYSGSGQLMKLRSRNGYTLDFSYSSNYLTSITDSYGRWISFDYSAYADVITGIYTSAGDSVAYSYNNGLIETQSFNGGRTITYGYANNLLTYKSNAKGQALGSFAYDANGNAIQTKHNTGSGFADVKNVSYSDYAVTVTDGAGAVKTYDKTLFNFQTVPTQATLSAGSNSFTEYLINYDDTNGVINGYTDVDGNNYSYSYDSDGWLQNMTRNGVITTFVWDKARNLLSSKTQQSNLGNRTTSFIYNPDGLPLQKTIASTSSGSRVWSYTWGSFGKLLTQTDPTGATTTYAYYDDNDADLNKRGMLYTVSNALGHTITFNSYDNHGNPLSVTMANGMVKSYTYNDIGQVLTQTVAGMTTYYSYDADGLLGQVQLPSGYTLSMGYDQAGRRTSVWDNHGGVVTYTLDDNGLPTNTAISSGSNVHLTANRLFDGLGRLQQAWGANSGEKYQYSYLGYKPSSEINPKGQNTIFSYSNDLLASKMGGGEDSSHGYDSDDNMTQVTANGVNYSMTYDEFSQVLTMSSPNTGTDSYSYNIANRTVTKIDAAGVNHTSYHDAIGRLTSVVSGSLQKSFSYDTNQVGRLSSAQNGTTSVSYNYNSLGQPTQKTQVVGSNSKSLSYGYDGAGQLTSITYPSGLVVNYSYSNGVLSSIFTSGAVSQAIASNIGYQPITFMPLSWSWGNGLTRSKAVDASGKLTSLQDGPLSQGYIMDGIFNITSLSDNGLQKSFEYDTPGNSLTRYFTASAEKSYTYSGSQYARYYGTDSATGANYSFSYGYDNNQLQNWTKEVSYPSYTYNAYSYTYDAKGNVKNNGRGTFNYNAQNNMSSATVAGKAYTYTYNGFDERVAKSGNGVSLQYMYNDSHQLIGEYSGTTLVAEYIYMGSIPIAVYKNGQIYMVHTDHLHTPRFITNSSGLVVWKWENTDPFGGNAAQNLGLEFNLRFMGQYFDKESNLHYNYYRYYDPQTGRYLQSDPIGIAGGFDTYAYVNGNPMGAVDPMGLDFINFGLQMSKHTATGLGEKLSTAFSNSLLFPMEEILKSNFHPDINNPNRLTLLSHGNPVSMHHNSAESLAAQIILGKFNTDYGIINNNYYSKNIKNNTDMNIKLEACDTGITLGNRSYAQSVVNILKADATSKGYTGKINLLAPNGITIYWWWGTESVIRDKDQTYESGVREYGYETHN